MSCISITIPEDLKQKINKIAGNSGKTIEDCIALALKDYIENYEDDYRTDLCAVDNLERSFFLSIGE